MVADLWIAGSSQNAANDTAPFEDHEELEQQQRDDDKGVDERVHEVLETPGSALHREQVTQQRRPAATGAQIIGLVRVHVGDRARAIAGYRRRSSTRSRRR